jgi:hypothetical protein
MTHQKSAKNIYQGALFVKFQGVLTLENMFLSPAGAFSFSGENMG